MTENREYITEKNRFTADDVAAILHDLPQGLAGPAGQEPSLRRIVNQNLCFARLLSMPELRRWKQLEEISDGVCGAFNKLGARYPDKIPRGFDTDTLLGTTVEKIRDIVEVSGLLMSPKVLSTELDGLHKLILNSSRSDAVAYLEGSLVAKALDGADDEIHREVTNYFTKRALLCKAANSRNAPEEVTSAIRKTVEIVPDLARYLEGVSGAIPDRRLLAALSVKDILRVMTDFTESADTILADMTNVFPRLEREFPDIVAENPHYFVTLVVRDGKVDIEALRETGQHYQAMRERAQLEAGNVTPKMTRALGRHATTGPEAYGPTLGSLKRAEAHIGADSETRRRVKAMVERGRLTHEDYGALLESPAYREILLDVDERLTENNMASVRAVLDAANRTRHHTYELFQALPHETDEQRGIANGIRRAITKRATEVLSLLPPLMKGDTPNGYIYHGDTPVEEVTVADMGQVIAAMRLMEAGSAVFAAAMSGKFGETTIKTHTRRGVLADAGRFESTDEPFALLIRPEGSDQAEARLGGVVYLNDTKQKYIFGRVISEKPLALRLKLDLERKGGMLSFDIGGTLFPEEQPLNDVLARVVSVGTQESGRRFGLSPDNADYHVREVFNTGEPIIPAAFKRYVSAVMYGLEVRVDQEVA